MNRNRESLIKRLVDRKMASTVKNKTSASAWDASPRNKRPLRLSRPASQVEVGGNITIRHRRAAIHAVLPFRRMTP